MLARAVQRARAMDEQPATVEAAREERRVLVLRAASPGPSRRKVRKSVVVGQRDERPAPAVGRVGDDEVALLGQPRDARVLDPPELLRVALGCRAQAGLGVDDPVREAVLAAGDRQVGDAAAILDAQEQDRLAVDERSARIEDAVGRVGQRGGGDDRVERRAGEEVGARFHRWPAMVPTRRSRASVAGLEGVDDPVRGLDDVVVRLARARPS